jgi:hypothetical protein
MMRRLFPIFLALAGGGALAAGAGAQTSEPAAETTAEGRRVSRLIVYGADPCPPSTADEIVVCARRSEDERYRIPEAFRGDSRVSDGRAWAAQARQLEYVGRTGIQSCSTVGPAGFTGCWAQMMREAREDRQAPEGIPIP